MFSYVFSSPFLKFKNDKLYFLNKYDLNMSIYEKENYFMNYDDIITKKILKINNIDIEYDILLKENDKNLLIKIDIAENVDELELNTLIYCIEKYISGDEDIDNICKDIDIDILKLYSNKCIKI
jgi:hypothetical protein